MKESQPRTTIDSILASFIESGEGFTPEEISESHGFTIPAIKEKLKEYDIQGVLHIGIDPKREPNNNQVFYFDEEAFSPLLNKKPPVTPTSNQYNPITIITRPVHKEFSFRA
jgi:hypothetical protein